LTIHGRKPKPTCRMRMGQVNSTRAAGRLPALPCRAVSSADVCAVIYSETPDPAVAAARAQRRRPRIVITAAGLPAGVLAARSRDCAWLWLLDGCAVPEAGALAALLAVAEALPAPGPLLLASKVVDQHGRLHPDCTPRHEILEKEHSVDAAERHLVQLRAAAHGSVLVARAAIERFCPPRMDLPVGLDMHEWSARLLRSWNDTGYLVPASVAVRATPPRSPSWREWTARIRVLASSAWSPRERLWEGFVLGRDAAAAIRAGRAHGRAGVGAPDFSPSRTPRRMTGMTRGANRFSRK
jgi:hypothetical protein